MVKYHGVHRLFLACALLIAALLATAFHAGTAVADPKLSVEVHPNYGAMDDAYIFSVVLENGEDASGPPLLSGGVDFSLSLIGPQSSVRIVNGTVTRKIIYNYQLIPKREGILTTPSAEVTVGGQKLSAEALSVTVKGARTEEAPTASKDYFMRQSLGDTGHVYVGQQLAHTLEIFTRVTILDPQLGDFTFPDFRNEQIGEQETTQRYVNGAPFTVTVLRRALFPLKAGKLPIPARELRARVKQRGRAGGFPFDSLDPFDPNFVDDFFGQGKLNSILLKSNPLEVEVDPLPPVPADLPLLGLDTPPVGPTTIRLQFDPSEIKFGETKTVTVTINSAGTIQSLKGLGVKNTPALRVYEETPQSKMSIQGNKLWTSKVIKLSLVPLGGGTVSLPPFEIGYFDPETRSYALAKTDPIQFNVTGAPPPPTAAATAAQTSGNKSSPSTRILQSSSSADAQAAEQMAYTEPSTLEQLQRMISLPMALLFLAALLFLIFAIWIGLRIRAALTPRRMVLDAAKSAKTIDALSNSVRIALQRRYPQLGSNFTRDELRRTISNTDLLYAIETLLDRCDAALFGGRDLTFSLLRDETVALLKKI